MTPAALADQSRRHDIVLSLMFFGSGFGAILYQLVWQRMLFTFVGVHVEAVTLVVTAFIVGLGLGSLLGGWASAAWPARVLGLFAGAELAVAAYGVASLPLFPLMGGWILHLSPLATAAATLLLVLPPTIAMGATLPLLVTYAVKRWGNVGVSVGTLYAVNTLGSAVAAFAASLLLMRELGRPGVVHVAVLCNAGAALAALGLLRRRQVA
jgi:predicted membrane-bound spermidine synthase